MPIVWVVVSPTLIRGADSVTTAGPSAPTAALWSLRMTKVDWRVVVSFPCDGEAVAWMGPEQLIRLKRVMESSDGAGA